MIRTVKLELYIILVALILAVLVISVFWALNRGEPSMYMSKQPTQTDTGDRAITTDPRDLEAETMDPITAEQSTGAYQGLAKLIEPTTVKALVFGDAVAKSQGASNLDQSSWHTLLSNNLKNQYPGTLQWQLETASGTTIRDALTVVPEGIQDIDLVILCLGRNDSRVVRQTEFKASYNDLIVKLKDANPLVDIFLVIEPPVRNSDDNTQFLPYRKIITDLGLKHDLAVIDGWSAFIDDPAPLDDLLADGVNPSDLGYRVFADAVLEGFEGYLLGVIETRL